MSVNKSSAPARGSRDTERATQEPRKSEAARSSRGPTPLIIGNWFAICASVTAGVGAAIDNVTLLLVSLLFSCGMLAIGAFWSNPKGSGRVNTEVAGGSPAQ